MGDKRLALGIDASGAVVGAEEYRRAIDLVRSFNRRAVEDIRTVESGLGSFGKSGVQSAGQVSSAFQRMATSFVRSGGSIRGVVAGLLHELLAVAAASEGVGKAIEGSVEGAAGKLATSGGLTTEVQLLASALKSASFGADDLARSVDETSSSGSNLAPISVGAAEIGIGLSRATSHSRELNRSLIAEAPQAARAFQTSLGAGLVAVAANQQIVLRNAKEIVDLVSKPARAGGVLRQFGAGVFDQQSAGSDFGRGVFKPVAPPQLRFGYGVVPPEVPGLLKKVGEEAKVAGSAIDGVGAAIGGIGVGGMIGVAAAVVGVGAAALYAAKGALELEKSLALVVARTKEGSIRQYTESVIELQRALGADSAQAASAYRSALLAGFKEFKDQQDVVTLGLKLFKVEGLDAAVAVGQIDAVLDVYNRKASDAGRTTNQLLAAARLGETTFSDMATGLAAVGAVAQPLGVDMEELEAVIATIAPKAGGASAAASGLSNLLLQLSDSSSAVSRELRKNGVDIDGNTIRTRGLIATLSQVSEGLRGREAILAQVFGSPRIAKVALSAIEDGGVKAKATLDSLRESVDLLDTSFKKVGDLTSERLEHAVSQLKAARNELGKEVNRSLSDLAIGAAGALSLLDGSAFKEDTSPATFAPDLSLATAQARALEEINARSKESLADMFSAMNEIIAIQRGDFSGDAAVGKQMRMMREEAEATARVLKEGLIPEAASEIESLARAQASIRAQIESGYLQGPQVPPPAPPPPPPGYEITDPNTPPTGPAPGLEFSAIEKTRLEAERFARGLDTQLGPALQREIAAIRESEFALRDKIESYTGNETELEKMRAALFAIVNQNDQDIDGMIRAKRALDELADARRRNNLAAANSKQVSFVEQGQIDAVVTMTQALFRLGVVQDATRARRAQIALDEGVGANIQAFEFQTSLIGQTEDAQLRLTEARQFDIEIADLQARGIYADADAIEAWRIQLEKALDDRSLAARADEIGHAFADPIGQGLDAWIQGLASWDDAVEQTVKSVIANLLRVNLINPFQQGILGLFQPGSYDSAPGFIGPPNPNNYMGNVVSNGTIIPHAFGGVPDIGNQPALFPMSNGRTGSLREGGRTEAIMPVLARAPTGELGVKLVGGSPSGSADTYVTVNQYISTPDVRGFRASERQLAENARRAYGGQR